MKSLCLSLTALILLTACATASAQSDDEPTTESTDMALWQAAVLGVVEGLTEYLPVSSTGHLILAQRAMGIGPDPSMSPEVRKQAKEAADAYAICIQGGAILAVLFLYFGRVKQGFRGLTGDPEGKRLLINLAAGFIPAAVIGLALNDLIREYLFGGDKWGLWPTIAAWFIGGVAILAVSYWRRGKRSSDEGLSLEELTWKMALIIGFLQCVAMWPGTSRSLMTIVGGVLVGMRLAAAVEFSFLLGLITLGAATLKDAKDYHEPMLATYSPLSLLVGIVFATLSAALAVKWMVAYLNKHGLAIFGYYRVALAIGVAALILFNVLEI